MEFMEAWTAVRGQVQVWGGPCPQVGNRRQKWRERWGVLLEVFDEEGRRGLGEASPLPGFSRDTLEECRVALTAWCRALPMTVNMFYFQKPPAVLPLPPAARFAVETALLDLQGKRGDLPVPVTRLLCRELYGPIYVSKLLSGRRVDSLAAQVRRGLAQNFCTFKLKLGGVGYVTEDVKLIEGLRAAVPGGWRLRVDLNGGWSLEQWQRFHAVFEDAQVELVEDPVPVHELGHVVPSRVPIAIDEPLKHEEDVPLLLRARCCSLWVLKPTVLGGFERCRQLRVLAQSRGIQTIVSHCFEGPVGLAAVRAVALLLGGAEHPTAHGADEAQAPPPDAAGAAEELGPPARIDGFGGTVRWQACYAQGVDLHPALTAFPPLPVPGGGAAELFPWMAGGLGVEP